MSPRVKVWWLSPVLIAALVVPLSVGLTLQLSDAVFRREWRTPLALTVETALLFVAGALAIAVGAAVTSLGRTRAEEAAPRADLSPAQLGLLGRAATVLFVLTMIGYAAFVVSAVRGGLTVDELVRAVVDQDNYDGTIKAAIGTIPGLTTLTQFGVASVICSALLWYRRSRRHELVRIALVLGLGCVRAFLFTERLAVLELLVPLAVVIAVEAPRSHRARRLVAWLPAVAIPTVFGAFAVFEYSRSWVYYRATTDSTFLSFIAERIAGYYATAYNNGQLELTYDDAPGRWPRATFEAIWRAPGIDQLGAQTRLNGYDPVARSLEILAQHGNPEFNNLGGIAEPFVDYGIVGGLLYFVAFGMLVGLAYRSLRRGTPAGLLLYPALFLGLLEVPRYLWWAQGRATPALVALGIVAFLLVRAPRTVAASPRSSQTGAGTTTSAPARVLEGAAR